MSKETIENYLQKKGIKYVKDFVLSEKPPTKPINKHTRAKKHGTIVVCPKCFAREVVFHFSWGSGTCHNCKEMIDKYDWLLETEERKVGKEKPDD